MTKITWEYKDDRGNTERCSYEFRYSDPTIEGYIGVFKLILLAAGWDQKIAEDVFSSEKNLIYEELDEKCGLPLTSRS